MAVFDLREQRMCVRIVYDGLAGTGKTTNLRQLSALFTAQRTTDLFSPAEIDGRTLFFDWMQIYGGALCGFPLLCQVISVPGQVVLSERRRHLLASADAVIYVCDSSKASLALARDGLAVVDAVSGARSEPSLLVIQANKQDQADAVAGAELLGELGRQGIPCVEAVARDGIGVVDTFITAVRTIVRSLQVKADAQALRVPVHAAESSRAVLTRLEKLEVDPEWAAEMFLEEAAGELLSLNALSPTLLPTDAPSPSIEEGSAPFPRPDVPTGFVWPAHTGRARLRSLADGGTDTVRLDAEGKVSITRGGFHLVTSRRARFDDGDAARQALVTAARERSQLGTLLSPETVVVLQPANADESWLWVVSPELPSVRRWLEECSNDTEQRRRLELFASAAAEACSYAVRHGVALKLSIDRFGVEDGVVRYVGELSHSSAESATPVADDVLRELSVFPDGVGFFAEALARELARRSIAMPVSAQSPRLGLGV
jgi:signal recognition particle receptor subunit beta